MEYISYLNQGLNKELAWELAEIIGTDKEKFDQFMPLFLYEEYRICQQASWTLAMVTDKNPEFILSWMDEVLKALDEPKHDAVVRNILRTFEKLEEYPEDYEGEIYDRCFKYLADPNNPAAIRVFAMTTARKIALKYPELIAELIAVIEEHLEYGTAGFQNRGAKELRILRTHENKNL